MKNLGTTRQKEIFPELEDDITKIHFEDRLTGKAVVFDDDNNIALVGNKINTFYLLPGGGIDQDESIENGIVRECLEEIGCEVRLEKEIGVIDDYRNRDKKHCINYCYAARVVGEKGELSLTDDEKQNGLHVIWVSLEKAFKILEDELSQLKKGEVHFYNTAFNIARDYAFLKKMYDERQQEKKQRILLLTDYRGMFYSSTKARGSSVDLGRLKSHFHENNVDLEIRPFSAIDFRSQNYKDLWVLYQSSEDPGLHYKSYLDDIVLGLFTQGAKLIPSFQQFRSHHNKHFLEIFRDLQDIPEIKNIESRRYGTYEDYANDLKNVGKKTFVIKSSDTSKSRGVFLLDSMNKIINIPRAISRTFSFKNFSYFVETIITGEKTRKISNHRKKFILQEYIGGLPGDYRVVIYGDKYYVLFRKNRQEDFRASGSMDFNYDIALPENLLNYSKKVFEKCDAPYVALDIGFKDGIFYLFEFQFLSFGQYTIENSHFYYTFQKNEWNKVFEAPDLEREIAQSVCQFINKHQ